LTTGDSKIPGLWPETRHTGRRSGEDQQCDCTVTGGRSA